MTNAATGIKTYTESPKLFQYLQKKEVSQKDAPYLSVKKR